MSSTEPVHPESEKDPWSINVADHPARADSPEYVAARQKMNEIATGATGLIYGSPPYQDHHGGALWFKDGQGWFLVRNVAGIEWSAQWCADPAKVDLLRQNAKRLYDLLQPQIKAELDPDGLLEAPITDAPGVAKWTDSIFNAGVPLQPTFHTGVLPANAPPPAGQEPGGVHHYPTPIADIQLFKYDDFQLWVADEENHLAAVVPKHPRGSGKSDVVVAYATPGSKLHAKYVDAHKRGQHLELGGDDPMAKQAFARQTKKS